jgi:ATP-dependent exoDNAse (exonuclease V) beta subunit
VTFTRNAASELKTRFDEGLASLLHDGAFLDLVHAKGDLTPYHEAWRERSGATLSTIHGFMATLLRHAAPMVGLDPSFRSPPEWEIALGFDEEYAALKLLAQDPNHPLHDAFLGADEAFDAQVVDLFERRALATQLTPAPGDAVAARLTRVHDAAYARVQARLAGRRLGPTEIERRAIDLLNVPAARDRIARRFEHVIIDEYQDVNPVQGSFFSALEALGVEVTVVGDPKQSIYAFRHADVDVFRSAWRDGERLTPLTTTRRHARLVTRFLNHYTRTCAEENLGFTADEAPDVTAAGPQANTDGGIEVHWKLGASLDVTRPAEADTIVERLKYAHDQGYAWSDMAVLAKSSARVRAVHAALKRDDVPATLARGRGFYERTEIRDLYHAVRVALGSEGASLAAWLRGPYAGLSTTAIEAVLAHAHPADALAEAHPDVAARFEALQAAASGTPATVLRRMLEVPTAHGDRFIDSLTAQQRANVDALLFELAEWPPSSMEVMLHRLNTLAQRDRESGDVPRESQGVVLMTMHASKGLEWPVVVVADLGAGNNPQRSRVWVHEGAVHTAESPDVARVKRLHAEREAAERYRLLYVAVSRARDRLILTGSHKPTADSMRPWVKLLDRMHLGPNAKPRTSAALTLTVETVAGDAVRRIPDPEPETPKLPKPAQWSSQRFPAGVRPPVDSPSSVELNSTPPSTMPVTGDLPPARDDYEPLPVGQPDTAGRLPGQGITVGTLLHDAIRRNARADDAYELELMRAQEVMFPYETHEQDVMLGDVRSMLMTYESLLGSALPTLSQRTVDHAEWPVLLPDSGQTWLGIIDRLYAVGDDWFLDDYKADRQLNPGRYIFQLATYRQAVQRTLGVDPETRLVSLRDGQVVPFSAKDLDEAWRLRRNQDAQMH